jgi:Domain of unknown function (DUF5753)
MAVPVEEADAWARAAGAPEPEVAALRELSLHALTEALSFRSRGPLRQRLPRQQREVAALEEAAGTIRLYHPCLLPSMAQTSDYMQQVFEATHPESGEGFGAAITARLERQRLLFDESHRFEFVVPEAALRWHFGSPPVQLGALDRLRQIAARRNVWLGVLPLTAGTAVWHAHGFNLYDDVKGGDPVVHVGALTTLLNISDPVDVDRFRDAFARLRAACVTGDGALGLIDQVMADLSALV